MELPRPTTVRAALVAATQALRPVSTTPSVDAEVLLRHVTGLTRTDVLALPARALPDATCAAFATLIERRLRGEPVAYLTGRREFWSLDLAVSSATLIPRPETELLVERALARIAPEADATIVDLGTGCGAIALAIAHERRRARLIAIDSSEAALAVARANAKQLDIGNIEFRLGDWLAPLHGHRVDVIVSNPPYVRDDDPHLQQGDPRFEPRAALAAGVDGLDAIRRITGTASKYLVPGGWLLLEHGHDQVNEVRAIFEQAGFRQVCAYEDLTGHTRVTEGRAA
jgi:release factor glutamine methyltransferase